MAKVWSWVAGFGPYYHEETSDGAGVQTNKTPVDDYDVLRKIDIGTLVAAGPGGTGKARMTADGGVAVQLTNRTGLSSVKGTVVRPSKAYDSSFVKAPGDAIDPCFIVEEDAIADGALCYCVFTGLAYVLLKDGTGVSAGSAVYMSDTPGRVQGNYAGDSTTGPPTTLATTAAPTTLASTAAPTTVATTVAPTTATATTAAPTTAPPAGSARRIGYALETKSAGTDVLALIVIQFG